MTCNCSMGVGGILAHCRSCCRTYGSPTTFDLHRHSGDCWDVNGVVYEDGIYDFHEGHETRRLRSEKMRRQHGASS